MVGSPFLLLSFLNQGAAVQSRLGETFGLLFIGLSMFSVWGLKELAATGRGAGKTVLWVQLGILLGATLWSLAMSVSPGAGKDSAILGLGDACWPLSMLAMLVTGVIVAAKGGLSGWRRWTPLLCGLALPLSFASIPVVGKEGSIYVFGVYALVAWAALGFAVMSETPRELPIS